MKAAFVHVEGPSAVAEALETPMSLAGRIRGAARRTGAAAKDWHRQMAVEWIARLEPRTAL